MRRPVLLTVALAAAACGGEGDGGEGATRAMVLETCAPGGDPVETRVCECAYDELRDRLDPDDLVRLDRQLRDEPDTVPAALEEAVLECAFTEVAPPTTKPPSTTVTTERAP